MKKIIFLLFILFSISGFTQTNSKKKYENNQGIIITDSIEIAKIKRKQKLEIEKNYKLNQRNSVQQNSYYLCKNGGFEEFELIGSNSNLFGFKYSITNPLNPTQCATVVTDSNINIPQYNPASFNLMATTVPSNYIDEFIGNIAAFDQYALKINYKNSSNTSSIVKAKRFKTNNETQLKFNYKAVLQSIAEPGHDNEQPFLKARIIRNNGSIASEFCLIGDPTNCIFTQAPTIEEGSIILYNPNWQSGILDISSIQNNEDFTIEFIASRCGLGGHFGYAYIDDICILHSNENTQGSIELDPLYKICPTFPLSVCGTFTIPNSGGINATVGTITLNIVNENNSIVYTSTTPTTLNLATNTFCFTIADSNLPNITTGNYNTNVTIQFDNLQTNCFGTTFNEAVDDDANSGWDITFLNCNPNCNFNVQPANLSKCDNDGNGKEFFDLELANPQTTSNTTGITFSFHSNYNDAFANTNPITLFNNYESYTGTIFIRLSKDATCFKITTVQLTVMRPQATISGILNICSGTTTLTASQGSSYMWSNGTITQNNVVSTTGNHSVTVTSSNGCSSTATITILTNQVAVLPNLQIVQPTCSSSTGSITVTSTGVQFSFDGGLTWSSNPQALNLPIGTYDVRYRTATGCESYDSQVQINPFFSTFPSYSVTQPTSCGDFGSITITSIATEYSFDDGITWSTNTTLSNLNAGNYYIKTKDTQGCVSNSNLVIIFAEYLNNPEFIFNNPYCGNLGSVVFNTSAFEYSIDGGTTWQTSNEFLNLTSGSYVLKIKNQLGCTSPNKYVYLKNLEDTYTDYTVDNAGCNKYASLTIKTLGELYSFDGGITWGTNNTLTNLNGPISIIVIVKKGNCTSIQSTANIYSTFLPLPIVTDYSTLVCDSLNDGNENVDLTDYSFQFVTNTSLYTFSYFNTENGALTNNFSDKIQNPTAYNLSSSNKIIYVSVRDSKNCNSVAKLDLTLIATPIIILDPLYYLCVDKTVRIEENSNFDSYQWSNGSGNNFTIINQAGNYSLTVTENHGQIICTSTKNFIIELSNFATFTNIVTIDWTNHENVITIFVDGIGEYEYSLDGYTYQDSNQFTDLDVGIYTVYVRDKHGCGVVTDDVFLLNYPYYFTPNGDGYNDTWSINFSLYEPGITVEIFDKYGKFLKNLEYNTSWDGNYNGHQLPSDDYWFLVTRANGKEHRGHFAMKR